MAAQTVGLDLGSSAIKVVKLEQEKKDGPIRLVSASSMPIPLDGVLSEAQNDRGTIAASLKKLFQDMHIAMQEVTVALPETQVFTRVIEVPSLSDNELESALRWQADQYIPLPLSEVTMDFAVLSKPENQKDKMVVLLVAAPLTVIEKTTNMLSQASLTPMAIETEIIACIRPYNHENNKDSIIMIIDSGATTTEFSILKGGILLFTHTTSIAGEAITRAISAAFNFEHSQAEEYKKVYGLDERHFQGKVVAAIKPIVDSIIDEIRKSILFFQKRNNAGSVQSIILSGGTALLPGLVSHLANVLGIEVQIGMPWKMITVDEHSTVTMARTDDPIFTVATGLALRSLIEPNTA